MHEAEAWWADNEAYKGQEKLQEVEVEEDAVAASQAHKFGSLLAIERVARKSAVEGGKVLAQNGFFSSSTAFPAAVPGPGTGVSNFVAEIIGQEQQRQREWAL